MKAETTGLYKKNGTRYEEARPEEVVGVALAIMRLTPALVGVARQIDEMLIKALVGREPRRPEHPLGVSLEGVFVVPRREGDRREES